ncbi:MAG: tetratricopeptide repeat protein [Myxococcales bacterium]|nr:tetratricopeptide repeat protein [Myxococcales bacterium]
MALLAAAGVGGLAVHQQTPLVPDGARLAVLSGASVATSWWLLSFWSGVFRRLRYGLDRRRARKKRRKDLMAERAYMPTPTFGSSDDEATVLMTQADMPVRLGAGKARALLDEADELAAAGQHIEARSTYTRVLRVRPSARAHLARGRVHLDLGDFDDAMADFMAAEDLDPVNPEPVIAKADLFFARKEYVRAIDRYDVALGLDPAHAMARFRRGLCHFYERQDVQALRDLERAKRLDPDIPAIDKQLALARRRVQLARDPR